MHLLKSGNEIKTQHTIQDIGLQSCHLDLDKTVSEITNIMVGESEIAYQIKSVNEISDTNKMVYLSDDFVD